jgi:hypothetical protein
MMSDSGMEENLPVYGWIWLDLWLKGVYSAFLDEYGWNYGC